MDLVLVMPLSLLCNTIVAQMVSMMAKKSVEETRTNVGEKHTTRDQAYCDEPKYVIELLITSQFTRG